jgi:hypothetical protein
MDNIYKYIYVSVDTVKSKSSANQRLFIKRYSIRILTTTIELVEGILRPSKREIEYAQDPILVPLSAKEHPRSQPLHRPPCCEKDIVD